MSDKRKTIRNTRSLIATIVLVAIILPGSLFFLAPNYLAQIRHFSYLFFILVVIYLVTSLGKQNIKPRDDVKPLLSWLIKIMAAESILYLLFFSVMHTALTYIPLKNITAEDISLSSMASDLLWQAGFQPWPMIAVLSVSLAHLYFNEKKIAVFSSFFPTFHNKSTEYFVKRMIQVILSIGIHFSVASVLSMGVLQLTRLLSKTFGITLSYSMNPSTLFFAIMLFVLMGSQIYRKTIHLLCQKNLSVGGFFLIFLLLLSAVLFLNNITTPFIESFASSALFFQLPELSLSKSIWQISVWAWWIGLTPLLCSYIARISSSRSFREIILGVLFFPILCTLFFYRYSGPLFFPHVTTDLLALAGPLIVILLFAKSQDSHILSLGWMPHQKGNIHALPRRTIKFIYPLLQMVMLICFIYLWFGLSGFCLFIILTTFGCFLVLGAASLLKYRTLKK